MERFSAVLADSYFFGVSDDRFDVPRRSIKSSL